MEITINREPRLIRAAIAGRFDAHTVPQYITEVVDQVDKERPNVVLDLSGIEFMDSSALAALVKTLKRSMEHGGDVILVAVADAARIILELTRLDRVFTRAESTEAARTRVFARSA